MNIMIPGTGPHSFQIIPRYKNAVEMAGFSLQMHNENTNTNVATTGLTNLGFDNGGYFNFSFNTIGANTILEGAFFILTLKQATTGKIAFRGRVFATNQPVDSYSINTGEFQFAPSTGNQFVIL